MEMKQNQTFFFHETYSNLTLFFIGCNPANICWSRRRLQHVFSVTILRLPGRLEDVLQRRLEDVLKTFLRPLQRRLEDVLEDEKMLR